MPIRVKCPNCGNEIKTPSKYRGKKISCPGCKEHLVVPDAGSEDTSSETPPSVTTVSPAKPGAFPPFSFSFGSASSEGPHKTEEDVERPPMPPSPEPEMQAMAYGVSVGMESKPNNEVHITRIKIPLGDAIWLIITFWVATLVIAVALFVTWIVFLMLVAVPITSN